MVNSAIHAGAATVVAGGPDKTDVFIALVTVEGLVFAALSISATLSAGGRFGSKTIGPPWLLSVISAALLVCIAWAAIAAWADLFAGAAWSTSSDRVVETIGLLLAIVGQPAIAIIIAIGVACG